MADAVEGDAMAANNPEATHTGNADDRSATFDGKADLGVLFVHGIGRQRRGDTLLAAGGALHEWLARWFTEGNVARGTSRGVLAELEDDRAAPAHVYTEMTQDDVTTGWWLAESWWAEAFPTPGFANLAIWAFQVMPWTLTSHFGTRARRARARLGWSSGWWKAWNTLRLAVDIGLLLVSFVLLLPLVALMGVLALVGAIPIQGLRNFVGAIQRALSSSLGDSYALLTSPITEAAIEETVRRDLEWLAERSDKVAVVAHSQGAAISHAVLRGPIPANVAMFVSVGSGLNKLSELRRAREKAQPTQTTPREGPGTPYAGAVGLLLSVPAFMWWFGAFGDADIDPTWLWIAAFAGAISLAVAVQRAWVGYPPEDVEDLTLPDQIDWIDLYASADPVPNGALFDPQHPPQVAGPRGSVDGSMGFDLAVDPTAKGSAAAPPAGGGTLPDSAVVHNRGSLLKDHNDYWRNRDGFMGALVQELSGLCEGVDFATLNRSDLARLGVAPRRRRWRVWWLGTVRVALMTMAALVPAVLAWRGELDEVGLPVTDGVQSVLNLLPWYSTTSVSGVTTDIAAAASIVIVAFLAYFVIQWLWRWWGYVETHRLYRRLPYEGLPPQALFASATLVLAIEIGVLTATGYSSGLASAAWESAKIAGALAVLGIFALAIGDRGLEGLWRKLPGGRSLIGAPGVVTTARVSFYVMFVALVMFPVYAGQAVNGWHPLDVTAVFYVTAAAGALFPIVWSARPLYELRRSAARWSYAGEVNLAQLRHAAPEAQRQLLDDAIDEISNGLDAADGVIQRERAQSPDLGEAPRWRRAARFAHEGARDAVDVYLELEAIGAGQAAVNVLEKAAEYCAYAATTYVDASGLDDAAAHHLLEPLTKTGPRRDRRIARHALRQLDAS